MEFKQFLLLSEMLVYRLSTKPERYSRFIAWRQHLWVGDHDDIESHSAEIYRQIMAEHPRADEIGSTEYRRNPTSIFMWVADNLSDAITGSYDNKTGRMTLGNNEASPLTSPLVAKVAKELKARVLRQPYNDEKYNVYRSERLKNKIPEIMYHGTATDYFEGIVRFGLMPMPNQSNYGEIQHLDKVFVAASLSEAEMHAFHTAKADRHLGKEEKGIPMVVAVRIPDPSKLGVDMDIDRRATGNDYDHSYWYSNHDEPDQWYSVNSDRASMHAGLFAYSGRIPARFIDHIRLYSSYNKKWFRLTPDKFGKCLSGLKRDYEFWYKLVGYPE